MSVEGKLKIKLLLGRNESLALRSVTRLKYVIKIKFIKTNTHYMGLGFFPHTQNCGVLCELQ